MMRLRRSRFFWRLFLGNTAVVAVALGGAAWFLVRAVDAFQTANLTANLRLQAATLGGFVPGKLTRQNASELKALVRPVLAAIEGLRVTFLDAEGVVLVDTSANAARMENHLFRSEIAQALTDGWGSATRWSSSVSRDMTYVAFRVGPQGHPEGYVRVAVSAQSVAAQAGGLRRLAWVTLGTAVSVAILLGFGLALWWERRLTRISSVARSLSRGDLNVRVTVDGSDEMALLARALNRMRDRLVAQVETVDRHRRTLESLLGQLREGVVVANSGGCVVLMNAAARALLNPEAPVRTELELESVAPLEQLVPQHELQIMLSQRSDARARSEDASVDETRIELEGRAGTVTLLARASDVILPASRAFPESELKSVRGRLLVVTDISALVQALKVRGDFVTNASHELRTPVAAIRAAVETLHTLDPSRDATSAQRFIDMIERHSRRLEALATDLLELSRVESGGRHFSSTSLSVAKISADVHSRWRDALDVGKLVWSCHGIDTCPTVRANAHLIRLILDNLVDNAIKFTPAGGSVGIAWRRTEGTVEVEVSDTGRGIPQQDQDRVFERFYQVAASRSGLGGSDGNRRGTGLGLSIVRHAAAALGAGLSLRSVLGSGTTVTLRISQARSPEDGDGTEHGSKNFTPT